MYDEKPETAFGASVVRFKSMTVRQKFGQNGNVARPLCASLGRPGGRHLSNCTDPCVSEENVVLIV